MKLAFLLMMLTQRLKLKPLEGSDKWNGSIPVIYTASADDLNHWIDQHVNTECVLGLDIESVPIVPWRKQPFEGPCTLQLATSTSSIVVVLRSETGSVDTELSKAVKRILEDKNTIKCGVGLDPDFAELYHLLGGCEGRNRLDLGGVCSAPNGTSSLKFLAQTVLNVTLVKSKKLSTSDWAKFPHSRGQIEYAARDAWVAAAVVSELYGRDQDVFSHKKLLQATSKELDLPKLVALFAKRKVNREEYKKILGRGKKRKRIGDVSDIEQKRVRMLDEEIKQYAVPTPRRYRLPKRCA